MKFSADDFKRLYAGMPDEELRSLVRAELSELARPCYDAELQQRGLSTAKPPGRTIPPVVAPHDPEDGRFEEAGAEEVEREEEEDLAPAAVFTLRADAKAARALLQSAAIPAFLENDTLGSGFRLLVAESYVEQAREVLDGAGSQERDSQ